jgi:hypothetical protein
VLWVTFAHSDADFALDEFDHTLYGQETLSLHEAATTDYTGVWKTCFYWNRTNAFFQYPEIDAAFLFHGPKAGGYLCVNEFGRRVLQVRRSRVYTAGFHRVIDPEVLHEEGKILAIRGAVDRMSHAEKNEYLRRQYGLIGGPVRWQHADGIAVLSMDMIRADGRVRSGGGARKRG